MINMEKTKTINETEEIAAIIERCREMGTPPRWAIYWVAKYLVEIGKMTEHDAEHWNPEF